MTYHNIVFYSELIYSSMKEKSVLIDKGIHDDLKRVSKESGISMKHIVEKGIELYIRRIKRREEIENMDL